jgi:hypothetical protein
MGRHARLGWVDADACRGLGFEGMHEGGLACAIEWE